MSEPAKNPGQAPYRYHIQHQAEDFVRAILPVPEDYPLRAGLPEDFRPRMGRLCALAKGMYLDMAKQPEAYGLMLVDIESQEHNLIRKARNTLHRLLDTLRRLSQCGEVQNHRLVVPAAAFREAIKAKIRGEVSNPVSRYELVLSRLVDFGFVISDFIGKPIDKSMEFFTIEYPDDPEIIDTIKIYCDCWDALRVDHSAVKVWSDLGFVLFDYKVTADQSALTYQQWLRDEALRHGYSDAVRDFYIAFYEYSLRYKGVTYDGDYNYKSKRIARNLQRGLGKCSLSLILKDMDRYISKIETMADSVKEQFRRSSCNHCGFQGATEAHCKFRRNWTFEGVAHDACAFYGFQFDDFGLARVPAYWRLLELEYGLKSASIS